MDDSVEPLLEFIRARFPDEDSWLGIQSAHLNDGTVELNLLAEAHGEEPTNWMLRCANVRSSQISNFGADNLEVLQDHPLLWPYTQEQEVVYFRGRPRNVDAAVGRLVSAHREMVGRWFDVETFINGQLHELLSGGFGKLGEGPKALMDRYVEALREDTVFPSTLSAGWPKRWDGSGWIDESKQLFVILLGESYIVAEHVQAERL